MKKVVIIGTGGHAKVVANIIELCADEVVGFLTKDTTISSFLGKPVLGSDREYDKFTDYCFIIAIGNAVVREDIAKNMRGVKWYSAIHPSAIISQVGTHIGEGSVISAGAVINPCSTIGKHCIINTGAIIEHDNVIDDFSHISVGTHLAGSVSVGKRAWVGIGACVKNNVNLCNDCYIGAGAVVVKDITEKGTYIGVPARKMQ
jgi:sugar O-acyltransferase (sialic acid O-acetyltransferase NeuD family)